ncbi:exodeoxyribonuclease VII large subunit [Paenibacillus aurantius]|uniref:Exodeoxyribonuclease 7 large subunit n=1 Tax=Paenibacillus aurantius TaxID=2918900 RepID=A0AA96L9X9_9BACL|nr:exodeoxyribonuclease VII large subunit [Paenibacillus aurantius]WNQ09390.1 exodeoxyribonuclease VII large subunit [Paenibacillus aurantius]
MNREQVLSIKELNRLIKRKLEGDYTLQDVWVRGEISNFTHHSSGHMYFTLKDAESRLKSIMFASYNQRLPFLPKEGTRVLARGSISVYERDGQYQFYVNQMQPDGIGSLYLAFEQLKKKLEEEGLFSPERKKPIPKFPKAIGVVTSPSGAAVRDILITLRRRYPMVNIIIHPVLVQGKGAASSIAKAIEAMNRHGEADVLIVGRGGGSLEELWAFNEEIVARSIFASRIPILSAVGHETDFTIADFVADVRAATPTAAAELAVPHIMELQQQLYYHSQRLQRGLLKKLEQKRERLNRLNRSPVLQNPKRQLQQPAQRLDRMTEQLLYRMRHRLNASTQKTAKLNQKLSAFNPKDQILYARRRVNTAERQMLQAIQVAVRASKARLSSQLRQLDALSPLKVMQRGYSLVYDEKEKSLINSVSKVQPGDLIRVRMTDGRLTCHVWSMEDDNNDNR